MQWHRTQISNGKKFQANPNWPVTEFSGIRWQWQVDSHIGQQMWFAIDWLADVGPMATQQVEPSAIASAEASGHQSEAMCCYVYSSALPALSLSLPSLSGSVDLSLSFPPLSLQVPLPKVHVQERLCQAQATDHATGEQVPVCWFAGGHDSGPATLSNARKVSAGLSRGIGQGQWHCLNGNGRQCHGH